MAISHKKSRLMHRGRHRKARSKTFSSVELAKKWAESQKLKNYDVVQLRLGLSKKFKVVSK
jgi:hypothetical protein